MNRTNEFEELRRLSGWRLGQPKVEVSLQLVNDCLYVDANFYRKYHAETLQEALEHMLTGDMSGFPLMYWVVLLGGRTGYEWDVCWPLFRRGKDSELVPRRSDLVPQAEPEDPPKSFWPPIQMNLITCHPNLEDVESKDMFSDGAQREADEGAGEEWKGKDLQDIKWKDESFSKEEARDVLLEISYRWRGYFEVGTLMLKTGGVTREDAVRNWLQVAKVLRPRVRAIRSRARLDAPPPRPT